MNAHSLIPANDDGSWLKTLKAEVHPDTFKFGREYAEGRQVASVARDSERVKATVAEAGGAKHEVEFGPGEGGKIGSACDCSSWNQNGGHCKHVVAAALVYLTRVRAGTPITSTATVDAAAAPEPVAMGEGQAGLAKLENWLGLSAQADVEFHYRLAPGMHGANGRQWVIDVRRADQAAKGPVQVKRTLAVGTRMSPADEKAFIELSKFEARFDSKINLSDEDLGNTLDVLADRRVIYRGTNLQMAEQPVRPLVHLVQKTDGIVLRIDVEMPDGAVVELKDAAVLPGRTTYVIVGQSAFRLSPDFPQRILRKWLLEPSMVFAHGQLDRVLSFFAAHLPRFRLGLKAEGLAVDDAVEPKFVLTLEGSAERVKAVLAARYGKIVTVPVSPTATRLGYATGGGDDGRRLVLRQEVPERAAGQVLTAQGFRYDPNATAYEATGDAALDFWSFGQQTLPKDWEVFLAQPPKVRFRAKVKPRIRVNMSQVNWFELDADFEAEGETVDLGAVRMWLDSGRRYVPLKDGSFAQADAAVLKRAADLLEEAGAAPGKKKSKLPLYQAPALDLLASLGEVEIDAKARKAMDELRNIDGIPDVKPPKSLQATLRQYQEAGLAWLSFLRKHGLSGVLADDMGLGKTIQALTLLLALREEHGSQTSLVVAPTSVLANWEREIQKFAPSLSVLSWHGQDRKQSAEKLKNVDVVLTSYAILRRDIAQLKELKLRLVILDEAQNIKNADSATAQACKTLEAETRLALTGTPLENRLSELWSLFDFLMPGFLGDASSFHDRFEHPIMVQGEMEVRDRLKKRIHPFVLRRLKTEVAKDLPPKTETIAYCEMDTAQAALYQEVLLESRRKVYDAMEKGGLNKSRISILAALMRLRQVCCDPRLLKLPPGTSLPPSAKLERFRELVDELVGEGHRALVFSQFTEMLELLATSADEKGLRYQYLDGRTKDRMKRVDAFNDPAGPPLFFISLKAGGTGLNLTAADYVIHYDPWWNPAVEDQATDRTHRIGQTKSVFSYKLITKGTVEEKIVELQKRKRDLAQGVLGTDAEVGKLLTEKDVEDLFRVES